MLEYIYNFIATNLISIISALLMIFICYFLYNYIIKLINKLKKSNLDIRRQIVNGVILDEDDNFLDIKINHKDDDSSDLTESTESHRSVPAPIEAKYETSPVDLSDLKDTNSTFSEELDNMSFNSDKPELTNKEILEVISRGIIENTNMFDTSSLDDSTVSSSNATVPINTEELDKSQISNKSDHNHKHKLKLKLKTKNN